jgi:hypothetical protein
MTNRNREEIEEEGIIDLIPDQCEGRSVETIKVGGRKWRVLAHSLEARPVEYLTCYTAVGWSNNEGGPWRCSNCGAEVEDVVYPIWTLIYDVLCHTCREQGNTVPRHCVYCNQRLRDLLPLDYGAGLKMLRCCPLHHCFAIVPWEGVE